MSSHTLTDPQTPEVTLDAVAGGDNKGVTEYMSEMQGKVSLYGLALLGRGQPC
jgi:hypothetical protein